MKKGFLAIVVVIAIVVLVIVGNIFLDGKESEEKGISTEKVYSLKDGDKEIILNDVYNEETLGKADSYYEVPSCAFEGMDKVYTYPNYEIQTYQDGDVDRIFSIYFLTDEIATTEGIKIGSTLEDVKKAYGENPQEVDSKYSYTLGKTTVEFIVDDGMVTSISYAYVTE